MPENRNANNARSPAQVDPRQKGIDFQLERVKRAIAVSGCKGGIGKSVVSTTLALILAKKGFRTGLLDLDFFSPSDHIVLGTKGKFPEEERGLIPTTINGLKFMSITYFTENKPVPLRGVDVSNAIKELLAITVWGELDFLVIDMPPGLGETALEIMRSVKKLEFLLLSTSSRLAWESAKKMATLLKEMNEPILGIIENMKSKDSSLVKRETSAAGLKYLGSLDFEFSLEEALGSPGKLLSTRFAAKLEEISRVL